MKKPELVFSPTRRQVEFLKVKSAELEIPVGELLRRIIDEYMAQKKETPFTAPPFPIYPDIIQTPTLPYTVTVYSVGDPMFTNSEVIDTEYSVIWPDRQ